MEDAATAEIARSQLWQWVRHGVHLTDGRLAGKDLYQELLTVTKGESSTAALVGSTESEQFH